MKQTTQLALYGAIAIIIERTIYLISNLLSLDIFGSKIYIALNTIEIIGFVSIANFFYVLYQKQNNKTNSNE
ncbi:hypothetical protein [Flavobacterium sp.]|uniref:hypothetical protein n=1 Tax=Flavobacterium sp. TaxID=239 RepID=UPI00286DAC3C|nr:hypothetical protein [Flavobacterium sp.]